MKISPGNVNPHLNYDNMRLFIYVFILIFVSAQYVVKAQQIDPILTTAVGTQTLVLNDAHKKRKKIQEKILAAQTAITASMDMVHSVENKMLKYLSYASDAVANIHQLKRIAELAAKHIPENMSNLSKAVGQNIKGTIIATIVSDKIADIYLELGSLIPFVSQLVSSGSYDVPTAGKNENHKINLLNSAERYYIANTILSRLEKINVDLYILSFQVRVCSWRDLWFKVDPKSFINAVSGEAIVKGVIKDWKSLSSGYNKW